MRIGELAKHTKISVRTLHYYDKIGLVSPSFRTESGHRLYASTDILRLQKVILLRSLAFSLDEIREFLSDPVCSPLQIIDSHIEQIKDELAKQHSLLAKLEALSNELRSKQTPTVKQLVELMEGMSMLEKYCSDSNYVKSVSDTIKSKWKPTQPSNSARALVSFKITRDGCVEELKLDEPSGSNDYDANCLEAVRLAAPFERLPKGENGTVTMQFAFGKKQE